MLDSKDIRVLIDQEYDVLDDLRNNENSLIEKVNRALFNPVNGKNIEAGMEYYSIFSIGVPADDVKEKLEKQERFIEDCMSRLAFMMNTLGRVWSIRYKSESGISHILFGIEQDVAQYFPNMLRSCFPKIEVGPAKEKSQKEVTCNGVLRYIRAKEDHGKEKPASFSFLESLGQAILPFNYCVTMLFTPIPYEQFDQRRKDIQSLKSQLSYWIKINLQKSIQSSDNISQNRGLNVVVASKSDSETQTSANTFGLTNELEDAVMLDIYEACSIENEKLRAAQTEGGWNVSISVETPSHREDLIVASIVSSAVAKEYNAIVWDFEQSEMAQQKATGFWYKTSELHKLITLPCSELPGYSVNELEQFTLSAPSVEKNTKCVDMGQFLWNGEPIAQRLVLDVQQFNRHAFVCGMTGAGKTNTVFHILRHINVPFFVIEPVKGEYPALSQEFPNMRIWTMDSVAQPERALYINPFWFPPKASLQFHIDAIKTVISSAFALYAAMPNILEQCIVNVYVARGWSIENGINLYENELPRDALYPTIGDLCEEVEKYLNNSQYDSESMAAYKGALLTRLRSLNSGVKGTLLNTSKHLDFDDWSDNPQIVMLDALSDDGDKAIVMGTLVVQYFQFVKSAEPSNRLKHLIVIEEAHRLFKNVDTSMKNPEVADPCSKLVDILTNMMAEIRAYGEGIIIADQSPTRVAQSVIKNANIKIVHRLDALDDAHIVANALAMKESEQSFALLAQGEAIVRAEKMNKPAKIKVPESKRDILLNEPRTQQSSNMVFLRRSSFADTILKNKSANAQICAEMGMVVNHIIFDEMSITQDAVGVAYNAIQNIISSYGYGEEDIELSKFDYISLMKFGFEQYLRRDAAYGNHHKFIQIMIQFFDRLIEMMICSVFCSIKELELLSQYRHVKIEPLYRNIILNTTYERKQINGVIYLIGDSYDARLVLEIAYMLDQQDVYNKKTIEEIKLLLVKVLHNFFTVKPSEWLLHRLASDIICLFQGLQKIESK